MSKAVEEPGWTALPGMCLLSHLQCTVSIFLCDPGPPVVGGRDSAGAVLAGRGSEGGPPQLRPRSTLESGAAAVVVW